VIFIKLFYQYLKLSCKCPIK